VLVLIAHLVPLIVMALPPAIHVGNYRIPIAPSRLYEELHGWEELGEDVQTVIKGMPDPEHTFVITNSYRFASQIRFYSGASIMTKTTGQKDPHQYTIWNDRYDLKGWDALFIDKKEKERYREYLQERFSKVEAFEPLVIKKKGHPVRTFYVVRCFGYK
jgi:hypothetical protein